MKTYLDSTVLVSLLCEHSKFKAAADTALTEARAKGSVFTSTHGHAETYRTLTTLQNPIPPRQARELLEKLDEVLETAELPLAVYHAAIAECARQGLAGAIVYDALHCFAAREGQADQIITRNPTHFELFKGSARVVELKN